MSLWSALHHPQAGGLVRGKVAAALRNEGRAHVTWQCSHLGLAIVVADKFIDLDALIAHAPPDQVFVPTSIPVIAMRHHQPQLDELRKRAR